MLPFEKRNRFFDQLFHEPGLMWLSQNTNHLPVHPSVHDALCAAVNQELYHGYAPPCGFEELRALIIEDLGLPGFAALVTDGAIGALYHTCTTLLSAGDAILAPDPGWRWPLAFARACGASAIEVPIYGEPNGYRLSAAALEAAMTPAVRVIYLVDPNNPTGACNSAEEIRDIADVARRHDAWLIHDCTYRHFADAHELAAHHYPERTVTTYSFSKWLGLAGLRTGALVAAPEVVERLAAAPPNNLGSNVISQKAAIAGLKVKPQWFPGVLATVRENQQRIRDAVDGIEGLSLPVYPSQTNFICLDVAGAGVHPDALCAAMRAHGILIRQAGYHSDVYGDRFVKVGTSVPEAWVEAFCLHLAGSVETARSAPPPAALY